MAASNLKDMPFEVDLDHRDFVEALAGRAEPADMAWSSLSIHHLQTDGKLRLMQALRASETAAGWLDLGRKAGFPKAQKLFLDPTGFYRLFRYDR